MTPRKDGWVLRVVDGDTVIADVDFPTELPKTRIVQTISLRLIGINAPEPDCPAGLAAKEFLKTLVEHKDVQVELVHPDKYGGRWDARLWINEQSVADALVAAQHAKVWNGKGVKPV